MNECWDNDNTEPVDRRVIKEMGSYSIERYGNPTSTYYLWKEARKIYMGILRGRAIA